MDDISTRMSSLVDMAISYSPKLLMALLAVIVGMWLITWAIRRLDQALLGKGMDEAVRRFLLSMLSIILKILLFFSAAEIVGIKTASFIAILAAAGFALGMALQGSLGNFAAGVMVIFFKPYRVGDIIEVADVKGKVTDIQVFNTVLVTPKNETIIVPNGTTIADKIINHSAIGNERVDVFFHIPYEQDFSEVQKLVMAFLEENEFVLAEPKSAVVIDAYDSHNVRVGVLAFSEPDHYWDTFYSITNAIKPLLGRHGIRVAYSEGIELGKISDA